MGVVSTAQASTWAEEVRLMPSLNLPHGGASWRHGIREPEVMVSLVTGACLLVEAVIAKNVIDVELDFFGRDSIWSNGACEEGEQRQKQDEGSGQAAA